MSLSRSTTTLHQLQFKLRNKLIPTINNRKKEHHQSNIMSPITYLTRTMSFCAAHRLHNPDMSDEENQKQFGRCNHPSSHGHNYKIEATVEGEIIPKWGYALNLMDLKDVLFQVVDPLDHKNLDKDIPFFMQKGMISSAENLAVYIWDEMAKLLPSNVKMHNLRVHETDNNFIDYRG